MTGMFDIATLDAGTCKSRMTRVGKAYWSIEARRYASTFIKGVLNETAHGRPYNWLLCEVMCVNGLAQRSRQRRAVLTIGQ